jgi:hypothetical protein
MNGPEQSKGDALDFVRDLLADEDQERIAELAPDALRAEMRERGLAPARAHRLVEHVLAEGAAPAPSGEKNAPLRVVQGLQERFREREAPRVRVVWWAVAAAAAIAIAVGAIARPAIVASRSPVRPPPPVPTAPPSPSPEPRAATLRKEAAAACAQGDFGPCEQRLDEAQRIDPAGENDVRVREARASIRKAKTPPPVENDNPKLSPH